MKRNIIYVLIVAVFTLSLMIASHAFEIQGFFGNTTLINTAEQELVHRFSLGEPDQFMFYHGQHEIIIGTTYFGAREAVFWIRSESSYLNDEFILSIYDKKHFDINKDNLIDFSIALDDVDFLSQDKIAYLTLQSYSRFKDSKISVDGRYANEAEENNNGPRFYPVFFGEVIKGQTNASDKNNSDEKNSSISSRILLDYSNSNLFAQGMGNNQDKEIKPVHEMIFNAITVSIIIFLISIISLLFTYFYKSKEDY
jgi:hypothetical protein